jgi:hypothetical protein
MLKNITTKLVPGDKYNRLTVVKFNKDRMIWEFSCECNPDEPFFHTAKDILNGNTKSCGCLQDEQRMIRVEEMNKSVGVK